MKVRIEFEIPNWTRWIAVGLVGGTVLGYGIANVRAGVDAGTAAATWQSGERLTAAKLNQSFSDLQNAINAQQATLDAHQAAISALTSPTLPDCPFGYVRDSNSTFVICKKGSDQVVKVGYGGAAFWIDRYEASIWDKADGTGQQYGLTESVPFPSGFPDNGQYVAPLYAMSVAGVRPSGFASWFQAQAACEAVGKRLPTGGEWLRAARGTPDFGGSNGANGRCLTDAADLRNTGEGMLCFSMWGAEDMIGNIAERTDEWYAAPGTDGAGGPTNAWPATLYDSDVTIGIESVSLDWSAYPGLPAAASRGGSLHDIDGAGIFMLDLRYSPSFRHSYFGFRCAMSR